MSAELLISHALDEIQTWGWRREAACAAQVCADARFELVIEPMVCASPGGTYFGCDVGIRSFRHQFLANWATESALVTCNLTRRLGQKWYPYFFAGGGFQLALGRHVSFNHRLQGKMNQKRATVSEALKEVQANVLSLENFAADGKIEALSSRDHFGPVEVGKAVCCALLNDGPAVLKALALVRSSWFARESIGEIKSRLLRVVDNGQILQVSLARSAAELGALQWPVSEGKA